MENIIFDRQSDCGIFTVQISTAKQTGFFEHNKKGDEFGGSLTFEKNTLTDYDGTTHLPNRVIAAIRFLGFTVPKKFENEKGDKS